MCYDRKRKKNRSQVSFDHPIPSSKSFKHSVPLLFSLQKIPKSPFSHPLNFILHLSVNVPYLCYDRKRKKKRSEVSNSSFDHPIPSLKSFKHSIPLLFSLQKIPKSPFSHPLNFILHLSVNVPYFYYRKRKKTDRKSAASFSPSTHTHIVLFPLPQCPVSVGEINCKYFLKRIGDGRFFKYIYIYIYIHM